MVLEVRCEKGDARCKLKNQRLHHSSESVPVGGETKQSLYLTLLGGLFRHLDRRHLSATDYREGLDILKSCKFLNLEWKARNIRSRASSASKFVVFSTRS